MSNANDTILWVLKLFEEMVLFAVQTLTGLFWFILLFVMISGAIWVKACS